MAKPNTIKYKPAYADTFTLKAFKTKDLVVVSHRLYSVYCCMILVVERCRGLAVAAWPTDKIQI